MKRAAALAAVLCAACARVTGTGEPAPPLSPIPLLQAPTPTLGDWESLKGKAVVLEFWGVDCIPCVDAIPHLNELTETFKDRPVVFLSVTADDEDSVRSFLKSRPVRGWVGLDKGRRLFDAFGVRGIPATFLIGPDGRLAGKSYGALLSAAQLSDVLAGKTVAEPTDAQKNAAALKGITAGEDGEIPAVLVRVTPSKGSKAFKSGPGLLKQNGMPLKDVLAYAHGVQTRYLELPPELAGRSYDVTLHAPGADEETLRKLLLTSVQAFFPHTASKVKRTVDAYDLTLVKEDAPGRKPPASDDGMGGGGKPGSGRLSYQNVPVAWLASGLEAAADKPVFDKTGLKGSYDLTLTWDPKDPASLGKAVSAQLGLRLVPVKASMDYLVVRGK